MFLSYHVIAELRKQTVSEFNSDCMLKITHNISFYCFILEKLEIYTEKNYTILSNTQDERIWFACRLACIHSENGKRRICYAMVIFKQIFSTSTGCCFIRSATASGDRYVSLYASRSDVPPLFSLLRFSLIARDDIVLEIIKFSALYPFFYARNFCRSPTQWNLHDSEQKKNPFIFAINNKISVFR